jgi:hypothetical protein
MSSWSEREVRLISKRTADDGKGSCSYLAALDEVATDVVPNGTSVFVIHAETKDVIKKACQSGHKILAVARTDGRQPSDEDNIIANTNLEKWLYYNTTLRNHTAHRAPSAQDWHVTSYANVKYDVLGDHDINIALVAIPANPEIVYVENIPTYKSPEVTKMMDAMICSIVSLAQKYECTTIVMPDLFVGAGYIESDVTKLFAKYIDSGAVQFVLFGVFSSRNVARDKIYNAYYELRRTATA